MQDERSIWRGRPSQIVNLGSFIILGLLFWLVIPIFIILWKWLVIKCTTYELTTERIILRYGVLNRTTEELELYRVRDYTLEQPLLLRLFSLGNVVMETSDRSHPRFVLEAIPNGEELRIKLRTHVEECRVKKKVREVDFE